MIVTNGEKIFIVFTLAQELVSRICKQLRSVSEVAKIHHQAFSEGAMNMKRGSVSLVVKEM